MYEKLKQSQRAGFGGGPFRFLQVGDPKLRIVVLVAAFVVLVAVMVGLGSYAKTKEATSMGENVPTPEAEPVRLGTPALDMTFAERLTDDGPDARRRWPRDAVHYLLLEARNTPAVHAYRRDLLLLNAASVREIEKDSRPWRFNYVRFRGPLEYIREEDHEETYGASDPELGLVHRGRVVVGDGVRVVFVTPLGPVWSDPNESVARPEMKAIEDGWVRGRGLLVQNYVEQEGEKLIPVLLVVATQIERDYEAVPVESLEEIPFGILNDDPSIAQEPDGRAILAKEYPRPLYRLVKYAGERAGQEGAALRREEGLKAEAVTSEAAWEELIGQPHRFRARYVGGLGAIAVEPHYYGPETITANDAGVEECLNGWILTDQRKLFQFIAPASLGLEWRQRTRIRWEGFFYKTKLYPARDGTERLAPVLVLTVLEEVPPPDPGVTAQLIIAGAFILGMCLLIFIIVREDRTKESYRRLRRRRVAAP